MAWIALGVLAVAIVFHGAMVRELHGTAAFYTLVSREAVEVGHWMPLTFQGEPYVLKPPLLFWLTGGTMRLFGEGTFVATLWARLFGMASLVALALLARRLFGHAAAFFATLILLLNGTFVTEATTFHHDTGLLFGIVTSVFALLSPRGGWRAPLFYAGIVVATLAKGLPGLLPLALLPLHAVASRRWTGGSPLAVRAWLAWAPLLAIPLAWYGLIHWRVGGATEAYLQDAFRDEIRDSREQLVGALHLYVWTPLERFLVFAPFVVWGVVRAIRGAWGKRGDRHRPAEAVLVAWIALVLVATVAKSTQREWYFLPALAPLAILGGREIARLAGGRVHPGVSAAVGAAALVGTGGLLTGIPSRAGEDPQTLAVMDRWVDARLPPGAPVPVLAPPHPPPDPEDGPPVGVREWSLLHLGRDVRMIASERMAARQRSPETFYLVYHHDEPALGPGWERVLSSRYASLIAPTGRRSHGP